MNVYQAMGLKPRGVNMPKTLNFLILNVAPYLAQEDPVGRLPRADVPDAGSNTHITWEELAAAYLAPETSQNVLPI